MQLTVDWYCATAEICGSLPNEEYSARHFVTNVQIVRFASALNAEDACHQRGEQQR